MKVNATQPPQQVEESSSSIIICGGLSVVSTAAPTHGRHPKMSFRVNGFKDGKVCWKSLAVDFLKQGKPPLLLAPAAWLVEPDPCFIKTDSYYGTVMIMQIRNIHSQLRDFSIGTELCFAKTLCILDECPSVSQPVVPLSVPQSRQFGEGVEKTDSKWLDPICEDDSLK
jgi:hypothetical protein